MDLMLELKTEVKDHLFEYYKEHSTENISSSECILKKLATPPNYTTVRLNTLSRDISDTAEIVTTQLKKTYVSRNRPEPNMYIHPTLPEVLVVENRGPDTGIKKVDKEVIVDLSCGMAVMRGADVFVQGIIGAPTGLRKGDTVSVYADIEGKCLKGLIKPYTGRKVFVGNGKAMLDRDSIYKFEDPPSGIGILMTSPLYEAPSLNAICPDMAFSQNLPSIVCSLVLDPLPGEVILDMCASPGGKTQHIATIKNNKYFTLYTRNTKGRVVALDKTDSKVSKIQRNCSNWNLTCVECYAFDSTKCVDPQSDSSGKPPYPPNTFDRILLDGPCSALGQRPSIRNEMSLKSLKSYPVYQKKLLSKAVDLLNPGGTLVYSTCTISIDENEKQVAWVLKSFPSLVLDAQVPHLGAIGRHCEGLTEEDRTKLQFFDPCPSNDCNFTVNTDTIGFFIAKFKKKIDNKDKR